jgi:hypothetical protein
MREGPLNTEAEASVALGAVNKQRLVKTRQGNKNQYVL